MNLEQIMQWRYAVKSFDTSKKVTKQDIEYLKNIIRLTPSSYGLQPYKVLIVSDEKTKQELLPVSYYQKQVVEASHLFVFANFTEISDDYLQYFYKLKADIQGKSLESLLPHMENVSKFIKRLTKSELLEYTALQTYMALESLLIAAGEKQIDTCAIGGFIPEKYNEILRLDSKKLNACVVAAVGYRSKDDKNQFLKKVRIPNEKLFIEV